MNKILTYKKINFSYKEEQILKDIDFEISENKIIGITGKSGTGKSTLLHILALIKEATCENIFFNGIELNKNNFLETRKKNFGFVYQQHKLMKDFNVIENIMIPNLLLGYNKTTSYNNAKKILKRLDLNCYENRKVNELSGGQKQRVSIARALINQPKIIFADEPTGNLDEENSEIVFNYFKEMSQEYKTSIVIVTHDLNIMDKTDKKYKILNKSLIEY